MRRGNNNNNDDEKDANKQHEDERIWKKRYSEYAKWIKAECS